MRCARMPARCAALAFVLAAVLAQRACSEEGYEPYEAEAECVTAADGGGAYYAASESGGAARVVAWVRLRMPQGCHIYGPRDCSNEEAPQCYSYTEARAARIGAPAYGDAGLADALATFPLPLVERFESRFFSYDATKYKGPGQVVGVLVGEVADVDELRAAVVNASSTMAAAPANVSDATDDLLAATLTLPLEVAFSSCSPNLCWHQYLLDTPGVPAYDIHADLTRVATLSELEAYELATRSGNLSALLGVGDEGGDAGSGLPGGDVSRDDGIGTFESCARSADVGQVLAQPAVLGVVLSILILMALSMWGLFDLKVPNFILKRLVPGQGAATAGGGVKADTEDVEQAGDVSKARSQRSPEQPGVTYLGALARGCTFGLVVSPCVGPFAASVLVYVATSRDYVVGAAGLFLFGMGLATILLLAAVASGLVTRLPEPGPWLDRLKVHSGFIVLISAAYFLVSTDGGATLAFAAMATSFGAWAVFIVCSALLRRVAVEELPLDEMIALEATRPRKWQRRLPVLRRRELTARSLLSSAALLIACVVAFFAVWGFAVTGEPFSRAPGRLLDPPPSAIAWEPDPHEGAQSAVEAGKGLFVDFYADWCVTCRFADYTTLADADVVSTLDADFVSVKCDSTNRQSECATLKDQIWGAGGMPAYVIVRATTMAAGEGDLRRTPPETVLRGKLSAARLNEVLERAAKGLDPEADSPDDCGKASPTERAITVMLCYPWGLLASLSPCVYPLVPTTLALFAGSGNVGRMGVVLRALCYAAGIAFTYAAVGCAVSLIL